MPHQKQSQEKQNNRKRNSGEQKQIISPTAQTNKRSPNIYNASELDLGIHVRQSSKTFHMTVPPLLKSQKILPNSQKPNPYNCSNKFVTRDLKKRIILLKSMKRLHTLALFYLRWLRKFSGLALRGEDLVAILVIIGDESKAPVPKA